MTSFVNFSNRNFFFKYFIINKIKKNQGKVGIKKSLVARGSEPIYVIHSVV